MSEPNYTDPKVAYNTGYNDGQREERDAMIKALEGFEVTCLYEELSLPKTMGKFAKLRRALARGVHRKDPQT